MKTNIYIFGIVLLSTFGISNVEAQVFYGNNSINYYYEYQEKIDAAYFNYYLNHAQRIQLLNRLKQIRRFEVRAFRDGFISYYERNKLQSLTYRFENTFYHFVYAGYNQYYGYQNNYYDNNGYYGNYGYNGYYRNNRNHGYYRNNGNHRYNRNNGNYRDYNYYHRNNKKKVKRNNENEYKHRNEAKDLREKMKKSDNSSSNNKIISSRDRSKIDNILKSKPKKEASKRKIVKDNFDWKKGK